jgi:hypothetical protein
MNGGTRSENIPRAKMGPTVISIFFATFSTKEAPQYGVDKTCAGGLHGEGASGAVK